MDYLGNKVRLADDIVRLLRRDVPVGTRLADVFAGTGSVSLALARFGYDVMANDQLPLSATWCRARLLGRQATFARLDRELGALGPDPQATLIERLARLPGVEGWITRNYSPVSWDLFGVERRYLTEDNARRVDAIRHQLREWRPYLSDVEHALLMASLVDAVTRVSNVAGTYGCYLKSWKAPATRPLVLRPYRDVAASGDHRVTCGDAERAATDATATAVYADPPYTKRQYAAYYHLLNTIATDEEPGLTGSTGLPDWRPLASEWCYKLQAPDALDRLAGKSAAPVLALSYSSDGHIPHGAVLEILGTYGSVVVHEFEHRRYRSSSLPHKSSVVVERLYVMQR